MLTNPPTSPQTKIASLALSGLDLWDGFKQMISLGFFLPLLVFFFNIATNTCNKEKNKQIKKIHKQKKQKKTTTTKKKT